MTISTEIAHRVESLIGRDRVRAPSGRETRAAQLIAEPETQEEIGEIVRMCEANRSSIVAIGSARTLGAIRRAPADLGISLARMTRVIAYEPADMTVAVQAGITIGELNAVTSPSGQRVALDPLNPGLATIGATIAAHHAGPLRLSEGTARDLLIGIGFVGHDGRAVRGGGRVVKNVAGYDLMKVMGGSFGTLGIITEAVLKLRPVPAVYAIATKECTSASDAFADAAALNDAAPLAHLEVTSPAPSEAIGLAPKFTLLAGISGTATEIEYLRETVAKTLGAACQFHARDSADQLYARLRDLESFEGLVAQVATPPSALAAFLIEGGVEFRAHAGCGVAQLYSRELSPERQLETAKIMRLRARACDGYLRVLRADPEIAGEMDFFDTPSSGALTLMRRMKGAFDPNGIFNPGCFVDGI